MRKQDFSEKFQGLKDMVQQTEVVVPTQKIVPNEKRTVLKKEEEPFTFWLSKEKMKQLKLKAFSEEVSIKEVINRALDAYLLT